MLKYFYLSCLDLNSVYERFLLVYVSSDFSGAERQSASWLICTIKMMTYPVI